MIVYRVYLGCLVCLSACMCIKQIILYTRSQHTKNSQVYHIPFKNKYYYYTHEYNHNIILYFIIQNDTFQYIYGHI